MFLSSECRKTCHCEPVRTLVWQSVLLKVPFLKEVRTESSDFGDADCHVGRCPPRNDIYLSEMR